MLGKVPDYEAFLGYWLNRKRGMHRRAYAVSYGVAVGMAELYPGTEYWESVSDSPEEARTLKAMHELRRPQANG